MYRTTLVIIALFASFACFLLTEARAQDIKHVAHVDHTGVHITAQTTHGVSSVASSVPADMADPKIQSHRANSPINASGIMWHYFDANSITNSVSLSDTTDETWVGHNLNFHRLGYFITTGDGDPIYESPLDGNPNIVGVACAENTSLGVVLEHRYGIGVSVRAFNADSGSEPLWTYEFVGNFNFNNPRNIDVSADGAIVMAAARDTNAGTSLVVVLDGETGEELQQLVVQTGVMGIELSEDGSRAVLTALATAMVVRTDDMNTLHTFSVSGAGGYHRISRDGTVVVAGGFDYKAYKETDEGWVLVFDGRELDQWYGFGLALSANGDTLFMAHYNYRTGILDLTYRVIDLISGDEFARTTTQGTGDKQDTIQVAQASADGNVFAVASWGTANNDHPEVQVFDRALNLIASIDTPGSPFDIDLSRDGRFLTAGTKHIHANTNGRGSDTYVLEIPVGDEGCGERSKLSAKCKKNGTKVIAKLKKALADTDVVFRLDGDQDKSVTTNGRGKASAKWTRQESITHTVKVCDLQDSCNP